MKTIGSAGNTPKEKQWKADERLELHMETMGPNGKQMNTNGIELKTNGNNGNKANQDQRNPKEGQRQILESKPEVKENLIGNKANQRQTKESHNDPQRTPRENNAPPPEESHWTEPYVEPNGGNKEGK